MSAKRPLGRVAAGDRVGPPGPGWLHNNGSEESVCVGALLSAPRVGQIREQEDTFLLGVPGVANCSAGSAVRVAAYVGAVGGQDVGPQA